MARASLALDTIAETLRELYREIAGLGLLAVAFSAAASWFVVRRTIRPLELLRAGADRYAKGDLQHRLPLIGAEEIRMLARSMNIMAEQLDQRTFAGDGDAGPPPLLAVRRPPPGRPRS